MTLPLTCTDFAPLHLDTHRIVAGKSKNVMNSFCFRISAFNFPMAPGHFPLLKGSSAPFAPNSRRSCRRRGRRTRGPRCTAPKTAHTCAAPPGAVCRPVAYIFTHKHSRLSSDSPDGNHPFNRLPIKGHPSRNRLTCHAGITHKSICRNDASYSQLTHTYAHQA